MTILYHVDAETKTKEGVIIRDYHLETPDQAEAESAFCHCWFEGQFWDVRIRKEWGKIEDHRPD